MAMAAGGDDKNERKLDQTPTWAVAAVCSVFIIISVSLEKSLHTVTTWLGKRQKKALVDALAKIKAELMILGFISLLLTFGQKYIVKICIPANVANKMSPCPYTKFSTTTHTNSDLYIPAKELQSHGLRSLEANDPSSGPCKQQGHEPLVSVDALHQLHILIFFLAVFHVLYSAVTMLLGRLKVRAWKAWEAETSSHGYQFSNDASRFRFTHETSFVRAHASFWTTNPFLFYIVCFFRQFYRSVGKADYLALRNRFITVHLAPRSQFNFQKYIKRSLEDDFKVVVGVSPVLWASFAVFLLLNVNGWHTMVWASLLLVIIIMAVGTKLQAILAKMAIEIIERHAVVQGIPLVQGSDKYFWFGRPQLVLHLIHFALFQNALQITYSFWIWYSFRKEVCFHIDFKLALLKAALGILVLCLCSYTTLPLHALVTQMGSSMKKSVFDEQTSKAIEKWRMDVKNKWAKSPSQPHTIPSSETKLRRLKTTGQLGGSSTNVDLQDDNSDIEADPSPLSSKPNCRVKVDDDEQHTLETAGASNEQEHS